MERIQRTLELAHPQRAAAGDHASIVDPVPAGNASAAHAVPAGPHARPVPIDKELLRERRVVLSDDTGPAAHAYRMLRTRLLRQARVQKLRMIGVVSAADGEGKTLTAINLALSIAAEPNQTALLVDLDLRKPSIAQLLALGVEQGLESWFEFRTPLAELFVRLEGIDRLRVLPTVQAVAGSSEVLAGARAQELLADLRGRYPDRLIIVDLPPALLADDFLTVSPQLDCVLLVVSEGRTRREDLNRMRELLGGVRVLGTVLNGSTDIERRAY